MTNKGPTELDRAWAVLTPPGEDRLASFPLETSFAGHSCRVALDRAGSRHLLVPAGEEILHIDDRPSTLSVALRKLEFGSETATYLDLSCTEQDLESEFNDVLADVLANIDGTENPGATALQAIMRWRRLFRSRFVRGLAAQARLGLFAELSMLSALLDVDGRLPADVWRGPLREPHDFEAPKRCIEVKAVGTSSDSIVIHGLRQLDTHDDRPLDLVLVTVVPDPDGLRIADLVDRVMTQGPSTADITRLLDTAGWRAEDPVADSETFTLGEVLRVAITTESPRIVDSSFVAGTPSGVVNVTYQVNQDALLPFVSSASLVAIASDAIG